MQNQRVWREKTERLRDLEERFEKIKREAATRDDYQPVAKELAGVRRAYRLEGEASGKRSRGVSVAMHTVMWPVWFTVAVDHELDTRRAYQRLRRGDTKVLNAELHSSLVVVAAAASAIEALLGDVRYLVPAISEKKRRQTRKAIRAVWSDAFGPPEVELNQLSQELSWLFETRNTALHAETEPLPTKPHPAGINSAVEHHIFNALTAGRAVDVAKAAILMSDEPNPTGLSQERAHWVCRWAAKRTAYHERVREAAARRSEVPAPVPIDKQWQDGGT